jgi:hypothetical protein
LIVRTLMPLVALSCVAAAPVPFADLATSFERTALATADQPEMDRVAAIRRAASASLPGVYPDGAATDRRIARALAGFPTEQGGFDLAIHAFPDALSRAVIRFRTVFPRFTPPLPIYLYHSLGTRDGGSAYLEPGHRLVMLFGADMIARLHADDSLEPFLDHELFHLEHQHSFPDCDQFWCVLWQEGLAVDAAASMNPGATDHQLLLDIPAPIRKPTDQRWPDALCFVATHFDDTDDAIMAQALQGGGHPPSNLPDRFGYYVGFRIARATDRAINSLDHLDHVAARKLMRATLIHLMADAIARCPAPPTRSATT